MLRLKRAFLITAASLVVSSLVVACGSGSDDPSSEAGKTLTIGTPGDAPPYEFQDETAKGDWDGINYEVMTQVFADAGYKVKYKAMSFAGMLPALSSGRIDLTTSLYDTPERRQEVDLLDFMQTKLGVLVRTEDADAVTDWADLCGETLAAILSNPIEDEVNRQSEKVCASAGKEKVELKSYPSITQELNDLDSKRLIGIIEDEGVLGYVADSKSRSGKYKVAFNTGQPNTFAIGFKKDSQLMNEIKPYLDEFLESKKPAKIAKKWGLPSDVFLKDSDPVSFK